MGGPAEAAKACPVLRPHGPHHWGIDGAVKQRFACPGVGGPSGDVEADLLARVAELQADLARQGADLEAARTERDYWRLLALDRAKQITRLTEEAHPEDCFCEAEPEPAKVTIEEIRRTARRQASDPHDPGCLGSHYGDCAVSGYFDPRPVETIELLDPSKGLQGGT